MLTYYERERPKTLVSRATLLSFWYLGCRTWPEMSCIFDEEINIVLSSCRMVFSLASTYSFALWATIPIPHYYHHHPSEQREWNNKRLHFSVFQIAFFCSLTHLSEELQRRGPKKYGVENRPYPTDVVQLVQSSAIIHLHLQEWKMFDYKVSLFFLDKFAILSFPPASEKNKSPSVLYLQIESSRRRRPTIQSGQFIAVRVLPCHRDLHWSDIAATQPSTHDNARVPAALPIDFLINCISHNIWMQFILTPSCSQIHSIWKLIQQSRD